MAEDEAYRSGSIGQLIAHLAPKLFAERRSPSWPPDAFALSAAILYYSGSYTEIANVWPPPLPRDMSRAEKRKGWNHLMRKLGRRWHSLAAADPGRMPTRVRSWWKEIWGSMEIPLHELGRRRNRKVFYAVAQIFAVADESCYGIGRPSYEPGRSESRNKKSFKESAEDHLWTTFSQGRSTLCREVETYQFQVLPKHHTPQQGLTLRSLSHHLALCPTPELMVQWVNFPPSQEAVTQQGSEHSLNILLVPWPKKVHPTQFTASEPPCGRLRNMHEKYGFFRYSTPDPRDEIQDLGSLFVEARRKVGRIDGLIMPELALPSSVIDDVYDNLYMAYVDESDGSDGPPFLVAGVAEHDKHEGANYAVSILTFPGQDDDYCVRFEQAKNHRWKLTASQIEQYGLGSQLDPEREWWEHISVRDRRLWFVVLRPWLTFCTLICEDLARPEPIADVIRAVGPNLVLALLMDGPQLVQRWPAQYATILAEDPGCSVLTLTSVGMAQSCVPPDKDPSRVVALWRDSFNGGSTQEITLPEGKDGIILTLTRKFHKAWSADGRENYGRTSFIQLTNRTTISLSGDS